jgi:hypothetical protein
VHRIAGQGRADPISGEVVSCTLARRFVLRAPDDDVLKAIGYLDCTPDIPEARLQDVEIVIHAAGGVYRIVESGVTIGEAVTPKAVVEHLHVHLFQRALEDRPECPLLHAACLRLGRRRLLIAGTKGAGKTTLALRMIEAGYRIEGDEQVFLDKAGVIARPRGCRVKAAGVHHFGDMAAIIASAPSYTLEGYGTTFNVDPRLLGSTWRIEHGPVDLVVVLEPNHGGQSAMQPLPPTALMRLLMPEVGLRETGRAAAIAAIASMAAHVPAFQLSLGEHAGALRSIQSALGE